MKALFEKYKLIIFGSLGAILVILAAYVLYNLFGPKPVIIQTVTSQYPNYVQLKNVTSEKQNIGGYWINRFDSEGNKKGYKIPQGTELLANKSEKIYFFTPEKSTNRVIAADYRRRGFLVHDKFGLSSSDLVELINPGGRRISKVNVK